tara:strand:- start:684 stop:1268 length:585 start_codon:yes stop_codon:yes gene_type:complete
VRQRLRVQDELLQVRATAPGERGSRERRAGTARVGGARPPRATIGQSPKLFFDLLTRFAPSSAKFFADPRSSILSPHQYGGGGGDRGGGSWGGGGGGGGWNSGGGDRGGGRQQQGGYNDRPRGPTPRPGDWNCPAGCGLVFASKPNCFRCGVAKPDGADQEYGQRQDDGYGGQQQGGYGGYPPVDGGAQDPPQA